MIIGISGPMHSGKSTLADKLVEHEYFFKESFAKPLKKLAAYIDMKPLRRNMQRLGQGARDILGQDVWVWSLYQRNSITVSSLVIDDVRYPNELAVCDTLIRLDCDAYTQWDRFKTSDKFDPDITEQEFLRLLDDPTENSIPVDDIAWDVRVNTNFADADRVFYEVRKKLQMID